MTSVKGDSPLDPACILKKGDHDFVKQDTQIYYLKAVELDIEGPHGIKEKSEFIQKHRAVSAALLKRIQEGALKSRFMKKRFQETVREHLKKPA